MATYFIKNYWRWKVLSWDQSILSHSTQENATNQHYCIFYEKALAVGKQYSLLRSFYRSHILDSLCVYIFFLLYFRFKLYRVRIKKKKRKKTLTRSKKKKKSLRSWHFNFKNSLNLINYFNNCIAFFKVANDFTFLDMSWFEMRGWIIYSNSVNKLTPRRSYFTVIN